MLAGDDSGAGTELAASGVVLDNEEVESAVELVEDAAEVEDDNSELEIKLVGSINGLEDSGSPVEIDAEDNDALDVTSAGLAGLDSDVELLSELDEGAEDVASIVDVLADEELDVVIVISSELASELTYVESIPKVLVRDDEEDSVELAREVAVKLGEDRETLSEVLELLSVKVLCEIGSWLAGSIVGLGEEGVALETSEEVDAILEVELEEIEVATIRLIEETDEVSKVSEAVEESAIKVDNELDDSSMSVELEFCPIDVIDDVENKVFGSGVALEDEEPATKLSAVVVETPRVTLLEEGVGCSEVVVEIRFDVSELLELEALSSSLVEVLLEENGVPRLASLLEVEVVELSLLEELEESTTDEGVMLAVDSNVSDTNVELDEDDASDVWLDSRDGKLVSGLVVIELVDVGRNVSISAVIRVLEKEDESSEELDVGGVLKSEVGMLDTEEPSLEELPIDDGSNVPVSRVVDVIEERDEKSTEELADAPSTRSLVELLGGQYSL
ncbi:hypothetical protein CORC01_04900 [Colletotrichum orchidophilum]|uniref:Uncharacterized protein n=1 Tax=Colletotrichum orchidophilum TaxID=1209926 RepID=A0A1G4BEB4_9PEZI|nr:uncharacterized protein CORC01_04900 [Colletotrichum orchidophilum]OHE99764.1 hypothetical protein CORC01_04900 [Colletotrichum orchidophilum]